MYRPIYSGILLVFNPFRTAVPFWGQTTWNLTGLSLKRDCGPERVKSSLFLRREVLRGGIVSRTCGVYKNLYTYIFLLTIFGPIYCRSPVTVGIFVLSIYFSFSELVT